MGEGSSTKTQGPAYGAHLTTRQFLTLVTALALGTLIEWYDFFVFSMLNATLTKVFFPTKDPMLQQISFWGVFFVGFVARPIGSIIFGHIGDTRGRRLTLLISICVTAVPTVLIGALPSYQQAGIAAPILLALLRLTQGLGMGGEFGGAIVYLHEIAEQRRQGFVGSIAFASAISGCILGVLMVLVLELIFNAQQMVAFAWRLPFLLSLISAAAALALRLHMPEPHAFLQQQAELQRHNVAAVATYRRSSSCAGGRGSSSGGGRPSSSTCEALDAAEIGAASKDNDHCAAAGAAIAAAGFGASAPLHAGSSSGGGGGGAAQHAVSKLPVVMLLRWHWAAVLLQFTFEAWVSCSFYTLTTWLPLHMTSALGIPTPVQRGMLVVNLVLCVVVQLIAGHASDRGLPRLWSSASVYIIAGAIVGPIMLFGMRPNALGVCWVLHALLLALVGWVLGLIPSSLSVIYPAAVRTTGFNLGHNMSMSWLGGLSPTIVTALTGATNNAFMAPTILLVAAAGISLLSAVVLSFYHPAANKRLPDVEDAAMEVEVVA